MSVLRECTTVLFLLPILLTCCTGASDPAEIPGTTSREPIESSSEPLAPTTGATSEAFETGDVPPSNTSSESSTSTETGDFETSSSSGAAEAVCGDGIVDPGESCDNGFGRNTVSSACLPDCTPAACGDGFVQGGVEDCDLGESGNSFDYGGCNKLTCKWGPRCGDGQVDVPHEVCDPGDPRGGADGHVGCDDTCRFLGRIAFISSTFHDGKFNGLANADKVCQGLATKFDATNAGSYRAWLSDESGSPATRFTKDGAENLPFVLLNGVQIASSFLDLTTVGPWPGIYITDEGQVVAEEYVWTGTGRDGLVGNPDFDCDGWTTDEVAKAYQGFNWLPADSSDFDVWVEKALWTNAGLSVCNNMLRIYCFEN